jgi:hypothetical protein
MKHPHCNIMVYPFHTKPYPCFQTARVNGMCRTHAKVMSKRLKRLGVVQRKVRSDKGVAKPSRV